MVARQWLAVHLVGDEDLGRWIGRLSDRKRALEGQVVPVGVREDRLQVVGAVVGALEQYVDGFGGRVRLFEHVMQQGARPPRRRDGIVAPWFACRQRTHLEAPVARAFERDGPLVRRQCSQAVERQTHGILNGASYRERAIVLR